MLRQVCSGLLAGLLAAAPAAYPQDTQPAPFTLTANARLVVTDVLVTDSHGQPVHGLTQNDFHIFQDGKPQAITAFDEQTAQPQSLATEPAAAKGVFTNIALGHLPPTVDVLLIDPFESEITDQMYLRLQLQRAIKQLSGHAVAVFGINSGHGVVMLQSFTGDPALLQAAVDRELPRLVANGGNYIEHYDDSLGALRAISSYLSHIPGHKNLLWFSSNFPFVEQVAGFTATYTDANRQELAHVYNQLSLDRVAVYPINLNGPEVGPTAASSPSAGPNGGIFTAGRDISGEVAMDKIAAATGGQAFYDRNDIGHVTVDAINSGSDYYTLSYVPQDYVADNKFHSIRVDVAGGPYTLHYRSGYVAFSDLKEDASGTLNGNRLATIDSDLDQLATGGKLAKAHTKHTEDSLTDYSRPGTSLAGILFEARILPAAQVAGWQVLPPARNAKGHTMENAHDAPYVIECSAMAHDVDFVPTPGGKEHAELILAALAYDDNGDVINTSLSRVQINFTAEQMQIAARTGVPLRQQIRLPKKKLFVALSLIDDVSGHTGSLQVPFTPAKQ